MSDPTAPPASPPSPPSPPPSSPPDKPTERTTAPFILDAAQVRELQRQNRALDDRLKLLEEQINKFIVTEERKFAKEFLDDVARFKAGATNDLKDFQEKFETYQQAASQARENAEKQLENFVYAQQKTLKALNEALLAAPVETKEAVREVIEAIKAGTVLTSVQVNTMRAALANIVPTNSTEFQANISDYKDNLKKIIDGVTASSADSAEATRKLISIFGDSFGRSVTEIKNNITGLADFSKDFYINTLTRATTVLNTNSEATAKNLAAKVALADNEKKLGVALDGVSKSVSTLTDKFLGNSKSTGFLSSALVSLTRDVDGSKTGFSSLADILGKSLKFELFDVEKAAGRLETFLKKNLVDSTFELDKAISAVNKSTGGFGKEFEKSVFSTGLGGLVKAPDVSGLIMYGMGVKDLANAYKSLASNVGGFNGMLDSQKKLLTESAAGMETLGINGDTYGKLVAYSMSNLQKDTLGAKLMIDDLAKAAIGLNVNVGEYVRNFQTALKDITGFGREAKEIFKELTALSQATKGALSETDLTTLSSKFQTIDGAADSISKLNAVFGGLSLNIMDVAGKDPAEVIMSIKRAASAANVDLANFDKLNIGYKRALAELFGGDVAKTAAFFKADLDEINGKINAQSASEKELEERKQRSADAQEKFNAAIDSMKISLSPILKVFTFIAETITFIANMSPFGPFIAGFATLKLLFMGARYLISQTLGVALKEVAVESNNNVSVMDRLRTAITSAGEAVRGLRDRFTEAAAASRGIVAPGAAPAGGGGTPPAGGGGTPPAGGGGTPTSRFGGTGSMMALMGAGLLVGVGTSFLGKYISEKEEKESRRRRTIRADARGNPIVSTFTGDQEYLDEEEMQKPKLLAGEVTGIKTKPLTNTDAATNVGIRISDGTGKTVNQPFSNNDTVLYRPNSPTTGNIVATQPGETLFNSIFGPSLVNMVTENPLIKTTKKFITGVIDNSETSGLEIFKKNPLVAQTKEFFNSFTTSSKDATKDLIEVTKMQSTTSDFSKEMFNAVNTKQVEFAKTIASSTSTEVLASRETPKPVNNVNVSIDLGKRLGGKFEESVKDILGESLTTFAPI